MGGTMTAEWKAGLPPRSGLWWMRGFDDWYHGEIILGLELPKGHAWVHQGGNEDDCGSIGKFKEGFEHWTEEVVEPC
jgi:hypothetical protein